MPESGNNGVKKLLRDIEVVNLPACRRNKNQNIRSSDGLAVIRIDLDLIEENAGT